MQQNEYHSFSNFNLIPSVCENTVILKNISSQEV